MRCQREHARSGWRPGPESAKLDRSAVRAGCRLPWRRVRRPVPVSIINPAKASRAAGVGMPAVDTRASVESLGNLERRMTFRLPAERLEDQVGGRLREIARTARIKGFRPGKVPAKVIEQRFGKQVRDEVLDGLLREGFDAAVRDNELRLAGSPRIEPSEDGGDKELAYVATFEVVPDFGEIDVSKLSVTRSTAEVRSEEHTSELQSLMRISYAVFCLKKQSTNKHSETNNRPKKHHI